MDRSMLVAFDFDHTIADDTTDAVVRKLLPDPKLPQSVLDLCRYTTWIAYMNKIFELLHKNSIDSKQIEHAIANVPIVPGIEKLLHELHANNFEIIVMSDSNTIFINGWLKSKKLDHLVKRVFSNPARIDENGMILVDMYQKQGGCKWGTANMCKGEILEHYIKERANEGTSFDCVAYVGDGRNDVCPILRLSERDFAFPRKDFSLMKLLSNENDTGTVKAKIRPWSDGTDILQALQEHLPRPQKCS